MKNVSKKLLKAVQKLGGTVPKTGYNSYSKYKYVTEADINGAVLPALLEQGLLLTTSVESVQETPSSEEQKNRFASVVLVHKIIDTDSGEVLEFKSAGTGADTLDKAIYKAYTGACKYFLMKTFMLSGDDDPENDGQASQAPAAKGLVKAPQAEKKGFMARKTEATTPAPTTGAKKPAFGKKAAEPTPPPAEEPEEQPEAQEESEEDAAY